MLGELLDTRDSW